MAVPVDDSAWTFVRTVVKFCFSCRRTSPPGSLNRADSTPAVVLHTNTDTNQKIDRLENRRTQLAGLLDFHMQKPPRSVLCTSKNHKQVLQDVTGLEGGRRAPRLMRRKYR